MPTRAADRLARLPGGAWLSIHDPGYGALRRAARAALVMPAMFALADKVIANPTMAYFVAFGSFAMLLLVDLPGQVKERLRAQAALGVACAVLICLGTLASESTAAAAVAMGVVAFVILFSGVVSSVLAGATTALLLAFILPVSLVGPASQIPDRVAGWGLAAAASLLAISVLWPAPPRNPVRTAAIDACRALAARLRGEIAYMMSDGGDAAEQAHHAAVAGGHAAHPLQHHRPRRLEDRPAAHRGRRARQRREPRRGPAPLAPRRRRRPGPVPV